MKKTSIAILLALALALGAASCGESNDVGNDSSNDPSISDSSTDDTTEANVSSVSDPVEFLNSIWSTYADEEKFAAGGGYGDDNIADDAAGYYELDADTLAWRLHFPADSIDDITAVGSLEHMLNSNTFTAAAYTLKDKSNASDFAKALRDSIQSTQWMCGFPDKIVIMSIDEVVFASFGLEEQINTFRDKITAQYPDAVTLYNEPIE